jgi:transposase-like protein
MGRPSLLTPERSAGIIDLIRSGAFVKTAAQANGISESTLHYWVSRADEPDADPMYSEFSEALTRARALAEVDAVKLIVEAGHKHWRAAAWFLERSFPEHYGNRRRLEHVGGEGGPITLAGLAELMGMDDERQPLEV